MIEKLAQDSTFLSGIFFSDERIVTIQNYALNSKPTLAKIYENGNSVTHTLTATMKCHSLSMS